MAEGTRPKKIKVEVEVDDREVELHIDPETGNVTIENEFDSPEDETDDEDADDEREGTSGGASKGIGLILGVLVGLAAGVIGGKALVQQLARPATGASQVAHDGQEGPPGDPLALLSARWREATHEGRIATEQEARRQLARYRELTEIEPNPPGTG